MKSIYTFQSIDFFVLSAFALGLALLLNSRIFSTRLLCFLSASCIIILPLKNAVPKRSFLFFVPFLNFLIHSLFHYFVAFLEKFLELILVFVDVSMNLKF